VKRPGLTGILAAPRTSYDYHSARSANRRERYAPEVAAVHVECFVVDAPDDWEPQLDWEHGRIPLARRTRRCALALGRYEKALQELLARP